MAELWTSLIKPDSFWLNMLSCNVGNRGGVCLCSSGYRRMTPLSCKAWPSLMMGRCLWMRTWGYSARAIWTFTSSPLTHRSATSPSVLQITAVRENRVCKCYYCSPFSRTYELFFFFLLPSWWNADYSYFKLHSGYAVFPPADQDSGRVGVPPPDCQQPELQLWGKEVGDAHICSM